VVRLLDRLGPQQKTARKVRVEFRSLGGKYPNAFALPGGIIVVSDELVNLAGNDEELLAVLAHELGHVERRHAVQNVLRGSASLLLISTITGDLSTLTSFAATIPLTLLQRGYSREFEAEADGYALGLLRTAKVDPGHFASILEKLAESRPEGAQDYTYLSTHPSTADRIQRINPSGHRPLPVAALSAATPATDDEPRVEVISPGQKDYSPPKPLRQPGPVYPFLMSVAGVEGNVTVEFVINTSGNVVSPHLVRSTHKAFEAAAIDAVLQWKFIPGRLHGRNVNVRVSQLIEFNLEDAPEAVPTPEQPKPADLSLRSMSQKQPKF
jgi:TonB family protein